MSQPPLSYAVEPHSSGPLVLGLASDGDHVVVVGGQGSDYYLTSEDGGRTFEPRQSPGRGLRSAWVQRDDVWVCGEYGYAAHSPDRGRTWHELETGASSCLFGVGICAEQLFLAGDSGFLIRVKPAGDVEYIELTRSGFSRFSPHPAGFLLPSDDPGQLFLIGPGTPRKLTLNAGESLMKARLLESGTLMVVGGGGLVLRSDDGGESFHRSKGGFRGLMCGIDGLEDAVYVVGHERQIWRSTDDGRTFQPVEHDLGSGYFWFCERVGDVLMIGAHKGAVIQIGEHSGAGTTLAPQATIGPVQQLTRKARPSASRSRTSYHQYSRYVRDSLAADLDGPFSDLARATAPDTPNFDELGLLLTDELPTLKALHELYVTGSMPVFDGLEVRLGRRTSHSREQLIEIFAEAYDDAEAHQVAERVRESAELYAWDGGVLIATYDGVWEWCEADPGLRQVCDDIGTLVFLLVRAQAAREGRFDKEELVQMLDGHYDDWMDLEFFEEAVG